jgi:hypothetical protein
MPSIQPILVFWQCEEASGVREFATLAEATDFAESMLDDNSDATIVRQ